MVRALIVGLALAPPDAVPPAPIDPPVVEPPATAEQPRPPPPPAPTPSASAMHAELADAVPVEPPPIPYRPRLVVANSYGLNFGMTRIPSAEVTLFLGGTVRRTPENPRHWTAVGLHSGLSFGYADGGIGPDTDYFDRRGLVSTRALALVHGVAGRDGYFVYSGGLGPVLYLARQWSDRDRTQPIGVGLDLEARLGVIFTRRATTRIQGVLGGQLRLSGVFNDSPVAQPLPQFGLFIGLTRIPVAPSPRRLIPPLSPHAAPAAGLPDRAGTVPVAPAPHSQPGDGRRLLIAGGVSIALSVPLIIVGSILFVGGALHEGPSTPAANASTPLLGLGVASHVAAITMLAVGSHRRRVWRAAQTP